jgi:hypothetical protein
MNSAYTVPLSVWRNRCWEQTFTLLNADQSPMDVSADDLALVVILTGTPGADPVVANATPAVTNTNSVFFEVPEDDLGKLVIGISYTWQFLRRPAQSSCSAVVCAGPLFVNDSPPFPTVMPV